MTRITLQGCFFLIFYFVESTKAFCQDPYLNLCDYSENEVNATDIEDSVETICDCQQVRFCFLIELSQECNSTVVKLGTDGNFTLSNQLHCDILPLDLRMKIPAHELLNQTGNEIFMNILTESNFGRYKISCSVYEIFEECNVTNKNEWELVSVDPKEVIIDSEVKLQLTVKQIRKNSLSAWCFVNTPDNTSEVLSSFWVSDTQINCMGFKPVIPGLFQITLSSVMTSNIFDKSINVKVVSKHPIPERAEYSSDFETISIYFDSNIELHSTCINVFSKKFLKNFGRDFDCFTRGNALVVRMRSEFQFVENVSISSKNKICRAGSSNSEFCLSATSANLVLLKPELLGPSMSLYTNPNCGSISSQKYMSVKIIPPKYSNYIAQNQTLKSPSPGKTHRKNLIIWRMMRKIQGKFSSHLVLPQTNITQVLSLLENISTLDDDLDVGQSSSGTASVSVFVQSSPSTSAIVAEASVTFCQESKLYWYKWTINRKDVFEDGKLLIVKNLAPGKYIIKCLVVAYNSSEILGQGWATTEILPKKQNVIITPSEITVGTTDNISLHAEIWPGNSISWTCKTLDKLCITTNQKLATDVFDLTSPDISIPAGTFPIGDYVWSVENAEGVNTAKVLIKPGKRVGLGVEISTFVKPFEEVVFRGTVKRAQNDCRAWWTSVRQKGFSYLNLNKMKQKEDILIEKNEVELVIPPPSENWRGLQSDSFYMFRLQVFCPHSINDQNGSLDYIKVPLSVNNPPIVSPLTVEPLKGSAMITNFFVSGGEADISDSLMFEWSYIDSCNVEIPIKRGAFGRNFTTYLPPGDNRFKLKVCNERRICSTTSTPTIKVIQESEFPAEHFQNSRRQIQFLMTSGDSLEALGLAITVFKSLALLHEVEFREMMFATVEECIKAKIKNITKRMETDLKAAELAWEFFERAVMVTKYFRKDSDILIRLTEFKGRILRIDSSKKVNRSFYNKF